VDLSLPAMDPRDEVSFEGKHCSLAIRRLADRVVLVAFTGNDVGEFGDRPFQELARDLSDPRPLELFVDARAAAAPSLDVSSDWARWLASHRASFRHVSMLTGSRFVQLTANFVRKVADLGELMRIYTDPASFEGALASSVANARG
jgi:hypothetical protein